MKEKCEIQITFMKYDFRNRNWLIRKAMEIFALHEKEIWINSELTPSDDLWKRFPFPNHPTNLA
jgi:hypothetical protein